MKKQFLVFAVGFAFGIAGWHGLGAMETQEAAADDKGRGGATALEQQKKLMDEMTGLRWLIRFGPNEDVSKNQEKLATLKAQMASDQAKRSAEKVKADAGDHCLLCMDVFKDGDDHYPVICGHSFHNTCLNGWLDSDRLSCPRCLLRIVFGPDDHKRDDLYSPYYPLHAALWRHDIAEFCRLLLVEPPIDVNACLPDRCLRPLDLAIFQGDEGAIVALLAARDVAGNLRVNLNCHDNVGYTPLHEAVLLGDIDLLKKLLAAGADVSMVDAKGMTPAQLARHCGHRDFANLIDGGWGCVIL